MEGTIHAHPAVRRILRHLPAVSACVGAGLAVTVVLRVTGAPLDGGAPVPDVRVLATTAATAVSEATVDRRPHHPTAPDSTPGSAVVRPRGRAAPGKVLHGAAAGTGGLVQRLDDIVGTPPIGGSTEGVVPPVQPPTVTASAGTSLTTITIGTQTTSPTTAITTEVVLTSTAAAAATTGVVDGE